jgi:signal transduction histidine kinase
MARQALESSGYAVGEAETGLDALSRIEAGPYDLVILDVLMPELDGFETCKRLRDNSKTSDLPVLMVTGLEDIASIEKAFAVGATNFMTKPLHWHLLNHQVKYIIRSADQQAALKAATLEAEAASKAKSNFLAKMSHELRTPMNAITGFMDLMQKEIFGPLGDARYKEYVGHIHESSDHLLDIINDILDFAKIESGKVELYESKVDVKRLIDKVANLVSPLASKGGVSINFDIAPDLPAIKADETKLKQILLNLMSNAIKFTPEGGSVKFVARNLESGEVHLSVVDTGIGIAKKDLPNVFDAFVQVEDSLDRTYEGTGLGIPIAVALAELHDGSLSIESALGRGTTVNVRLPRSRVILEGAPTPKQSTKD